MSFCYVVAMLTSAVEAETGIDPFTASRPSQLSNERASSSALQSENSAVVSFENF